MLKKSKADNSVLFIDASQEFVKNGNKNLLTSDNLDTIFTEYHERKDVQYKAKLVSNTDILANDFNLSVSSYVEQEDKREKIDIDAINATLAKIVCEGNVLRKQVDEIVANL